MTREGKEREEFDEKNDDRGCGRCGGGVTREGEKEKNLMNQTPGEMIGDVGNGWGGVDIRRKRKGGI